jgi:hypothetical protein
MAAVLPMTTYKLKSKEHVKGKAVSTGILKKISTL